MSKDSGKSWIHSDNMVIIGFSFSMSLNSSRVEIDKCIHMPTHVNEGTRTHTHTQLPNEQSDIKIRYKVI